MLSRVANSIYWFGRNLERAENTARLVRVHANLLFDLPRKMELGWAPLLAITSSEELFASLYKKTDETSVVRFLLADERNPDAIVSALNSARANLRTIRDIVPREAWEQLNELFLYVHEHGERSVQRHYRLGFLEDIVDYSHTIAGLLGSAMSRDDAFNFLRMGINLERADMTTRIIDIRSESLLPHAGRSLVSFENIQWMSVLKSLTAYQMYRRHKRLRVVGPQVLSFLLQDEQLPRSVYFCLDKLEHCLARLPRSEACRAINAGLQADLRQADVLTLVEAGFSEYLDRIQLGLADIHDDINQTYFQAASIESAAEVVGGTETSRGASARPRRLAVS